MMKKTILIAIIAIVTFTACKKSKTEEPTALPTVVGLWKGAINTVTPLALYLKSNNTIDVFNSLDTAATLANGRGTGTWSQANGTTVNVNYKFNQQIGTVYTGTLTVNTTFTNMTGNINALGSLFGNAALNK